MHGEYNVKFGGTNSNHWTLWVLINGMFLVILNVISQMKFIILKKYKIPANAVISSGLYSLFL